MDSIEFIDCNCMIGLRTAPSFLEPKSTKEIKDILVKTGVKRALAYHSRCVKYHPLEGNKALLDEMRGDGFFMPVWVIMPGHTGEFPKGEKLKSMLLENNIEALKVNPLELSYSLSVWSMKECYEIAEGLGIPIIVAADHITWDTLDDILSAFPDMKIILASAGYRTGRYIYPLMERHKNLFFEISMYKNHMGIEHLCKAFGSERILFGSGLPKFAPGSAKSMVLNADIPDKDKADIAGGNIMRLIGGGYA